MEKIKKKKKACPKCHETIYLVGNSIDGSYRILTCKNKECEHYMRILKDKNTTRQEPETETATGAES